MDISDEGCAPWNASEVSKQNKQRENTWTEHQDAP